MISGNSITDARNAAIADQVWWNESPHYQLGSADMLDKLTIAINTNLSQAIVSGNTCSNVANTSGCY